MSTPDKKKKPALLDNLLGGERRRHQVAMITEEGDWNQHESNSGMARVFVVMLLVHVVLIGSIIVYDFIGTDEVQAAPAPIAAKTPAAPQEAPAPPAAEPAQETAAPAAGAGIAVAGEYEVQSGDSLRSIAARHGVAVEDLIAVNQLEDGRVEVQPLTILKIPAEKVAEPARVTTVTEAPSIPQPETPAPAANVLPIQQDPPPAVNVAATAPSQPLMDTTPPSAPVAPLVPVQEAPPAPKPAPVMAAAPKPASAPAPVTQSKPESKPAAPAPAASGARSHTMGKGDTLYSLSRKYGVSVTAIQKANNISNPNAIREGTKLVIPAK